jgi:SAM-dependent methyltransferase
MLGMKVLAFFSLVIMPIHAFLSTLSTLKPSSLLLSMQARSISINDVLKNPQFPEKWPFRPQDFKRQDESNDGFFYSSPRLVYHIDDFAIESLTNYYKSKFFPGYSVLDICSSWVSHFPKDIQPSRAAGIGMNQAELMQNKQLTEYIARDLNVNPTFPYDNNSFDFVTCVVSVDYLIKPLEIFNEINRVLKPGGLAIISQSNRCFPTKAIDIWLHTNDLEHVFIIGSYFHYAGGFEKPESFDISPHPGRSDPMYIIQAKKSM